MNDIIFVTGGAGYIGSHACKELRDHGYQPVVIDNMVYGHEWAVQWGPLEKCDLKNTALLDKLLRNIRLPQLFILPHILMLLNL